MTPDKNVNVGQVSEQAAETIDTMFMKFCLMLKEHGKEIIPKKMLYPAAIWNFLTPALEADRHQSQDLAIEELIEQIKKFWKENGGHIV